MLQMKAISLLVFGLVAISLVQSRLIASVNPDLIGQTPAVELTSTLTQCKSVSMPNASQEVYAGYLPIGQGKQSMLYYMFFHALEAGDDAPIGVWLNGGPGVSSQIGSFFEAGPYRVTFNNQTGLYELAAIDPDFTWNKNMHFLVVDQPAGAGYSYLSPQDSIETNSMSSGLDFYYAIQNFFNLGSPCNFQKYASNPFFVFGESFAGHYIPGIAYHLIKQNEAALKGESTNAVINFKGIGIGDGWTAPLTQMAGYTTYAYNLGLMDINMLTKATQMVMVNAQQVENGELEDATNTWEAMLDMVMEADGGFNSLNIDVQYPLEGFVDFLNYPDVKENFGVDPSINWVEESAALWSSYNTDIWTSYESEVAFALENIDVLLYNGQLDWLVNPNGALTWITNLDWDYKEAFESAAYTPWEVNGQVAGMMKQAGALTFKTVNGAGHLVPYDQPINSRTMIEDFMSSAQKK